MTVSRLLAVINGTPESRAVMRAAVSLGKKRPCLIDGLHVRSDKDVVSWSASPFYAGPIPADIVTQLREQQDELRRAAKSIFEVEANGLPYLENGSLPAPDQTAVRWQDAFGDQWDVISEQGRTHDLILVSRPTAEHWESESYEAEAALFDSGRGVLIVPQEKTEIAAKHVAIAWADTPEAARSVTAADPFLDDAERVSIITVTKNGREEKGIDGLIESLKQKGLDVEIIHQIDNGEPVADQILDCVNDLEADLLIMGAYGHSRLRELLLGGATRGILRHAEVPVLMAH